MYLRLIQISSDQQKLKLLIGNPAKAESKLGWKREISFQELVERMVKNDLELVKKEAANN